MVEKHNIPIICSARQRLSVDDVIGKVFDVISNKDMVKRTEHPEEIVLMVLLPKRAEKSILAIN